MSNPHSNVFSRHESIEEILISMQILHNSQSQTMSSMLPTRKTKEKKGDEKTFSPLGSVRIVYSLPPLLLSKKSL